MHVWGKRKKGTESRRNHGPGSSLIVGDLPHGRRQDGGPTVSNIQRLRGKRTRVNVAIREMGLISYFTSHFHWFANPNA